MKEGKNQTIKKMIIITMKISTKKKYSSNQQSNINNNQNMDNNNQKQNQGNRKQPKDNQRFNIIVGILPQVEYDTVELTTPNRSSLLF